MLSHKRPGACRILYIVGQLSSGGLERQLYYLLRAMDRERYRPGVVVWRDHGTDGYVSDVRSLGIPLYFFERNWSPMSKIMALRRMMRTMRPEVVHSFSFYTNYAAHLASLCMPSLAIGSLRSDIRVDRRRVGTAVGLLSARWPSNQVSNNLSTADYVRESWSPFVPKRVHVVRNAVDLTTFRDCGRINHGRVTIVGIGSLLPIKRWDRVLQAAKELKSLGYEFHVRIAGQGPLRNSLERQAQTLQVSEQVEFVGHVSDIPKFISEGSFLIHTSDTEGCPNAVMESMACGRAVIATRVGDVHHLVDDEQTGFIVDRDDHRSLVTCMATLIRDQPLCVELGLRARSKAERDFAMSRLAEDMLAAYRAAGWKDVPDQTAQLYDQVCRAISS